MLLEKIDGLGLVEELDGPNLVEEVGGLDLVVEVSWTLVAGHGDRLGMEVDRRCTALDRSQSRVVEGEEVNLALAVDVESRHREVEGGKPGEYETDRKACDDLDPVEAGREDVDSRHEEPFDYHDEEVLFYHKMDHVRWRKAGQGVRGRAHDHPVEWAAH